MSSFDCIEPASTVRTLVVGMGVSGRAIARYLAREGVAFEIADTREVPPELALLREAYPEVLLHCGSLERLDLEAFDEIVLSPGIDTRLPALARVRDRLIGEMALLRRALDAMMSPPQLIAITGSNAKSTVTTLVGEMARESGIDVAVGGNLGTPALDLLVDCPRARIMVLELSSFQLETTPRLGADIACFLNLSEDHLDRHDGLSGYGAAKQRIFEMAGYAVYNADDPATRPRMPVDSTTTFTLGEPEAEQWGVRDIDSVAMLCHGDQTVMPAACVCMPGRHNQANALAALAIGYRAGWSEAAMVRVLERFAGLAHRAELVARRNGVRWINDSKGTNVGATLAAIEGIGATIAGRLILLAGGLGKGADFAPLASALARCGRAAIVFGSDGGCIARAVADSITVIRVDTLAEAMHHAEALAEPGDAVLLSPACASLDQFAGYAARGDAFRTWLAQHPASIPGDAS